VHFVRWTRYTSFRSPVPAALSVTYQWSAIMKVSIPFLISLLVSAQVHAGDNYEPVEAAGTHHVVKFEDDSVVFGFLRLL
jgi:hypothetical protein